MCTSNDMSRAPFRVDVLPFRVDVLPHFNNGRDAVNYIKAANIPIENVPKWKKVHMIKLQAGEWSQETKTLQSKGYYCVLQLKEFNSIDELVYGKCFEFAKNWIRAVASCGPDQYRKYPKFHNAQIAYCLSVEANSSPLAILISDLYADHLDAEYITCCMNDDDTCAIVKENAWVTITFEELLVVFSSSIHNILKEVSESIMHGVHYSTELADRTHETPNNCDISLQEKFCALSDDHLKDMAHIDFNGDVAAEIKKSLFRNREFLNNCRAFD